MSHVVRRATVEGRFQAEVRAPCGRSWVRGRLCLARCHPSQAAQPPAARQVLCALVQAGARPCVRRPTSFAVWAAGRMWLQACRLAACGRVCILQQTGVERGQRGGVQAGVGRVASRWEAVQCVFRAQRVPAAGGGAARPPPPTPLLLAGDRGGSVPCGHTLDVGGTSLAAKTLSKWSGVGALHRQFWHVAACRLLAFLCACMHALRLRAPLRLLRHRSPPFHRRHSSPMAVPWSLYAQSKPPFVLPVAFCTLCCGPRACHALGFPLPAAPPTRSEKVP